MSGILKKHADNNWYDRTFSDFEQRLEAGKVSVKMIRGWDLIRSECLQCGEPFTAFKYKGTRYELQELYGLWIIHQCAHPQPEEPAKPNVIHPEPEYGERDDRLEAAAEARGEIYPDDPEVRDGDGEIRGGGWTDPGTEPRSFADDPYSYPDIPYVDPTR